MSDFIESEEDKDTWLINGQIHKMKQLESGKWAVLHFDIDKGLESDTFSISKNSEGSREAAMSFLLDHIQGEEGYEILKSFLELVKNRADGAIKAISLS